MLVSCVLCLVFCVLYMNLGHVLYGPHEKLVGNETLFELRPSS
jgi:hypothetical protein